MLHNFGKPSFSIFSDYNVFVSFSCFRSDLIHNNLCSLIFTNTLEVTQLLLLVLLFLTSFKLSLNIFSFSVASFLSVGELILIRVVIGTYITEYFIALKCLPTKLVPNPDHLNAFLLFPLTYTTIVRRGENLARETTPVSPIFLLAISVLILQRNRGLKLRIDIGTLGNRNRIPVLAKMIWICWVTMRNLLLVLKQTLRVLRKIYFPHPYVPNHCVLNLFHSKLPVLSHPPQVQHHKINRR